MCLLHQFDTCVLQDAAVAQGLQTFLPGVHIS